jgi:hypothetical protein
MMTDLVVLAARRRAEAAEKRLRLAPKGTRRVRDHEFVMARAAQLRAELEVSTETPRH